MQEKSIWLKTLGIEMLNNESSPIAIAYRYIEKLFEIENAYIYLKEDGQTVKNVIYIKKGTALSYSFEDKYCKPMAQLIEKVIASGKSYTTGKLAGIALKCSKADSFGAIIFESENFAWSNEKDEAIKSFSELLYAELMGGFLKSSNKTLMKVKDVCVCFDDSPAQKNTVDNVSLEIKEGELTIIMGRSGCGKSTLLNVMAGLLTPKSGEVFWNGCDICSFNQKDKNAYRRDDLGYIFQNYNLIAELTAGENVAVSSILSDLKKSTKDALALVGLSDRENHYPRQMSGGEQQRVSIARALIKDAKILLCDEPTGALDTENAKIVMCILQNLAKIKNIPVVIVTHNPDYSVLADHYILLKDGRVEDEFYNHFPFSAEKVL